MRQNIKAILFLLLTTFVMFVSVLIIDINRIEEEARIEEKKQIEIAEKYMQEMYEEELIREYTHKLYVNSLKQIEYFIPKPAVPPSDYKYSECQIPDNIVLKIKEFEEFYSRTYWDAAGVLTIGYGFTKDCIPKLKRGDTMTKEEADKFLVKLINEQYLPCIRKNVKVPLNENQLGSLVSLVHNIGTPAFEKSQMLKYINEGDFDNASDEFDRWVKVNGKPNKTLRMRRIEEKKIFLSML